MIAGRETDARVALALGIEVYHHQTDGPYTITGREEVALALYSTDIAAAVTLLDGRWWDAHVSPAGKAEVKIYIMEAIHKGVEPTLPLAICAAFLASKEIEP